jgi:hypothetical protein
MAYTIVYWNGLKKDGVKVQKFETKEAADFFLKNGSNQFKEYLLCEYKGEKNGVAQYRVLNRGTYIVFKIFAYIVSLTVMVAIIAGIWYLRNRFLLK